MKRLPMLLAAAHSAWVPTTWNSEHGSPSTPLSGLSRPSDQNRRSGPVDPRRRFEGRRERSGTEAGIGERELLGLDHEKLTFYHNGSRRRLTDVHGHVVQGILI
jgi:hypothetical protein